MTLVACLFLVGLASNASATLITFDALTGPSTFGAPNDPLDFVFNPPDGEVQFNGGTILTKTTFLPGDQTSVYGTFSQFNSNPITVNFLTGVNGFFLDLLNGNTVNVTYRIADNTGHSRDFTLAPNVNGGHAQIGFGFVGTTVTITALPTGGFFDFFIDNVNINAALPVNLDEGAPSDLTAPPPPATPPPPSAPGTVPEPASTLLMASGFAGLALAARHFRTSRDIS
jgi:hypothetical protein